MNTSVNNHNNHLKNNHSDDHLNKGNPGPIFIHCNTEDLEEGQARESPASIGVFKLWFNTLCLVVRTERAEAALF